MKRRAPVGSPVPADLLNFNPQQWSDDFNTAYRLWRDARNQWVAAGNVWPGGEVERANGQLAVVIHLRDEPLDPSNI